MNIDRYNRSLWLMLLNDSSKRKTIGGIISNIPFPLRAQINKMLELYDEYQMGIVDDSVEVTKDNKLTSSIEVFDGCLYFANIDLNDGLLTIGFRNKNNIDEFFEISLVPDVFFEYSKLGYFDSTFIGRVTYNLMDILKDDGDCLTEFADINYELINTPFGTLLEFNTKNSIFTKKIIPTKRKKMPRDLNIYTMINAGRFR